MDSNSRPQGRARGRSRGQPRTTEEANAAFLQQQPGGVPPRATGAVAAGQVAATGRGRGASADREPVARGRGVSQEREGGPAVSGGRAFHRGSVTGAPGSDALSSAMSSVTLGSSGSNGNGGSGSNGAVDANGGSVPSVGRGATRGRRDRAQEFFVKTRPDTLQSKKGAGGMDIALGTNYFQLVAKPNWRLLQYRVDMKPDIDNTRVKKALLYSHKPSLPKILFDGTILFTTTRLSPDDKPLILSSKRDSDGAMVEITIKLVAEVQPTDYHYMQFFNIVLRQAMEKMQLELIRRNYFDPKAAVVLNQHKLEIWPGYVTSIRQHEDQILLCCEISCKVLRTDTVLEQIEEIYKRTGNGGANFRPTVEKALLGAIVITRYNNATYRIDEIAWDKHPTDEFEGRNNEKISYLKYYETKYNKKIRDPKQVMIISMPKVKDQRGGVTGPIYLVPELCFMTGLSDEQRANFQLMKAMGDYTRQGPEPRVQTLNKFSERLNSKKEIVEELSAWNLKFAKDLVQFRGRILEPEVILGAGSSKHTYNLDNADWGGAFRKWNSFSVGNCQKWAVVFANRDEAATKEFVNSLKKVAPSLGMTMGNPKTFMLTDNRPATYIQQLDQVIDMKPSIVMIVIPNNKGDHYAAIKKKCCLEKPIPSQCVTGTVLSKPKGLMSVATKVAIQMNTKLGGEPWAVKIPLKDTMVIGYDTYHDSAQKGRSVGAVVASMNSTFTKYLSVANLHTNPAQELNDNMCPAITKALRKYAEINGALPARVIMYRDGVGDGQIPYVVEHEIAAIQNCFKAAGLDETKLLFTYIIVSKRINTRFFKMGGKPSNPPSGTIVDDVVTLPERYDFFLVSQSVRQGTVNPTSYNVIKDTSGLKPDHIQKLTYKLTHLYYNWPGTVRVPAPCQYAHKLAFLVGESLHREPSEQLEQVLYYL